MCVCRNLVSFLYLILLHGVAFDDTKVGVAAFTLECGSGVGPVKGHGHRGHIRISVARMEGHSTGNGRGDAPTGFRTRRPDVRTQRSQQTTGVETRSCNGHGKPRRLKAYTDPAGVDPPMPIQADNVGSESTPNLSPEHIIAYLPTEGGLFFRPVNFLATD